MKGPARMATKKEIRALADAAEAACEKLRDTLQEFFDDKSERWQEGEAGDEWQGLIDAADCAFEAANDARPE